MATMVNRKSSALKADKDGNLSGAPEVMAAITNATGGPHNVEDFRPVVDDGGNFMAIRSNGRNRDLAAWVDLTEAMEAEAEPAEEPVEGGE